MRSLLVVALVLALGPSVAAADPAARLYVPIFSARYWYAGRATLDDAGQPDDLALEGHTLRLRGMFGHRVADWGTILLAALRYDLTLLEARLGDGARQRDAYHAPFLRLGLVQRLGDRWSLLGYALGGLGSDMEAVALGDLRLTVGAGAIYRASDRLRLVFGAMYTTDLFVPLPLPLLTVSYRAGPLRLELRIPKGADGWLALRRWLELGVVVEALNLRYGLHAAGRFGEAFSALNVTAGPALRLYLYRGGFVRVDGGWNVRHFRVERGGQTIYERLTFAGGFLSTSVGYML